MKIKFLLIIAKLGLSLALLDQDVIESICDDKPNDSFHSSPSGQEYYLHCFDAKENCYEEKCDDGEIFVEGYCDKPAEPTEKTEAPTTKEPAPTVEPTTTIETTTKMPTTTEPTTETPKSTSSTTMTEQQTTTTLRTTTVAADLTTFSPNETTPRPKECPADPGDHPSDNPPIVILLSKKNCSEYFICYHGEAVPMYCANKLHFNAKTNKCDLEERANCEIDESDDGLPKCVDKKKIEYYPHPKRCNYFIFCNYGYKSLQQCPFYYNWEDETKSCIPKYLSDCNDSA